MRRVILAALLAASTATSAADKQLLWGDTHLHTTYSSDAYTNNNLSADPDTAYRFAKGMPVIHPYHRARVQIGTPLDFLVVSDHAEFLGQIRNIHRNGVDTADLGPWDSIKAKFAAWYLKRAIDSGEGRSLFVSVLPDPDLTPEEDAAASSLENSDIGFLPMPAQVEIDTWRNITDSAERHNQPGQFTALIGWEWSSIPAGANLHRVVITDSDAATAQQYDPFGLDDSPYPEDLWAWLEETSASTGADFVAIPHNSNISKGYMFSDRSLRGEAFTRDYVATRQKWEPVAEITQIKGDSETHSTFAPEDEFADFENYPYYIQRRWTEYTPRRGDFVREALKRGLEIEHSLGLNPYRLGVIGSTDSHTSTSSAEEDNFLGKLATDSIPENKQTRFGDDGLSSSGWAMSASGLAAVWATENTREAILQALRRREVYATTGPRIGVQFYGGAGFLADTLASAGLHELARNRGVPMGGELRGAQPPSFVVIATRDPVGANLDRIQIVKGWLEADGSSREKVYNIAWAGERELLADGSLPAVGNTVDLRTGKVDNSIGAAELSATWTDPDFDPRQAAFYYARILQIPTARHSLLDAVALGMEHAAEQPDTLQERAYTSPIWYRPD
ncbi:MAG: hypothetical protein CME59_01700 [Halioglobus sp.]|nr:hypothetical protein [Halioglobus sp.]|tara:strand:- start:1242 stop:3098 length:1857 start_codon:yes stop_codon:yes gene_type:complete